MTDTRTRIPTMEWRALPSEASALRILPMRGLRQLHPSEDLQVQ